ncbi:MAG TPA: hypothetical protein DE312_04830 [Gallionella sp.]|nr:hypothetical protein [Gallionella sp.]
MSDFEAKLATVWGRLDTVFGVATDISANRSSAYAMLRNRSEGRRELTEEMRLYCDFEQFIIATCALREAQNNNEVSQMGDWIQWSLVEEPSESFSQVMHIGRMVNFLRSPVISKWPGFYPTMVLFFRTLYDYARRRTAIKDICIELWGMGTFTFRTVMFYQPPQYILQDEAVLGCNMLCWAAKESFEQARELTPLIEEQVSRQELSPSVCALFCITLATNGGRFSEQRPVYWAQRALTEFASELSEMDKAQMMATTFQPERRHEEAELLLEQMRVVQMERLHNLSGLAFTRHAGQNIEFIQPYFVRCLDLPDASLVLRGLQTWYDQNWPDDPLDSEQLLILLPFGENASTLVFNGEKQVLVRDTQASLEKLSRSCNEFLGTYSTVAYADNSDLEVPERPGVPREHHPYLLQALQAAYCPAELEVRGEPTCQLILPTEGHPIQATQLLRWGSTWPIASSLGSPRPDRRILSVLIWGGGTITESMETEMVRHAFEHAGADVRMFSPEACSHEDFIREYENSAYDIIWVVSHGEFDHWSPHEVRLHLAPDQTSVSLDDLWNKAPITAERRLLVLNVCDGARFSGAGLLPRVGLAPGLAAPFQATISHLWPVQSFPSAAFGAFLAHFLSAGRPYFESYVDTLKSLAKSAPEIGAELARLYGQEFELTKSLRAREQDFGNIEIWGSAAFFQ